MFARGNDWRRRALGVVAVLGVGSATALAAGASGSASPPPEPRALAAVAADDLVARRTPALRASQDDGYLRHDVVTGTDGLQYVPYDRTYKGLPVVGGDFVVNTDAQGNVLATSVAQPAPIALTSLRPKVGKAKAESAALRRLTRVDRVDGSRLVVDALGGNRLAWETVVSGALRDRPSRLHVYVDAGTGKVIRTTDDVAAGSGTGHYNGPNPLQLDTTGSGGQFSLRDPNRSNLSCADYGTGQVFTGPDDNWGNGGATDKETGCVDSLFAAQRESNMVRDWLGRNGLNGSGGAWPIKVGLQQVNAYFTGSEVQIGYNNRNEWISALDVVTHEMGHGIDSSTPGGISQGGTQEFVADTFGFASEWYVNEGTAYDPPDYSIGEEVDLQGSGPIRYAYKPSLVSGHPDCYSSSVPNLEVHAAAGPGNHWFYLLAEGTSPSNGQPSSTTCDGSSNLTGVGIQNAIKVMYNAMLLKTSGSSYANYRKWTLQSAKNLDPTCGLFAKTKAAWDAISLGAQSGEATCTGGGDTQAPSVPGNVRVTGTTASSISLAWDASTDNVGVTGYDVYRDGALARSVAGTTATVDGLAADTAYSFTVKAKDAAGNVSAASPPVSGRTGGGGGGNGITNGGFESSLTGWTSAGTTSAVTSGQRTGAGAARTGTTTATRGDSSVSQTFTVPAGASQLSFWYNVSCPDAVLYAYARATLKDDSSGATTTVLAKTCTDGQGWKQVTAPVTAGRSYTLTLINHDDNYPSDPVYTVYDDVTVS